MSAQGPDLSDIYNIPASCMEHQRGNTGSEQLENNIVPFSRRGALPGMANNHRTAPGVAAGLPAEADAPDQGREGQEAEAPWGQRWWKRLGVEAAALAAVLLLLRTLLGLVAYFKLV
jgi:hypothetical protein